MTRIVSGALFLLLACSPSTRLVQSGPHPPHIQEFVPVPYPPPPAQVEELSYRYEDERCFWLDGHYAFAGRAWTWVKGRWVVPGEGCYYAKSLIAWSKSGEPRLYYTPPRWYRNEAATLTEDRARCPEPTPCR